ncbi:MAG: DNA alkylation repair protein, partial [Minisyncoccia bacterium]
RWKKKMGRPKDFEDIRLMKEYLRKENYKNLLIEIRKILKNQSNSKVKESIKKFVAPLEKVYGVKTPVLNEISNRFRCGGFELVEILWKSGSFEEKIVAAKILGKICNNNPEKTLELIKKFSRGISDWAVCDSLATQGVRKIAKIKQKEIFELSKKLIKSKNFWQRRFGIVLLLNLKKEKSSKKEIEKIIKDVEKDKEYYVKKAVEWIKRKF